MNISQRPLKRLLIIYNFFYFLSSLLLADDSTDVQGCRPCDLSTWRSTFNLKMTLQRFIQESMSSSHWLGVAWHTKHKTLPFLSLHQSHLNMWQWEALGQRYRKHTYCFLFVTAHQTRKIHNWSEVRSIAVEIRLMKPWQCLRTGHSSIDTEWTSKRMKKNQRKKYACCRYD